MDTHDDLNLVQAVDAYDYATMMDSEDDQILVEALDAYESSRGFNFECSIADQISDRELVELADSREKDHDIAELINCLKDNSPTIMTQLNYNHHEIEESEIFDLGEILDFEKDCEDRKKRVECLNERRRVQVIENLVIPSTSGQAIENSREYLLRRAEILGKRLSKKRTISSKIQYGDGRDPLFVVTGHRNRYYKKFEMQGVYYTLKVNDPDPEMNPEEWLLSLLNSVITYFKNHSEIDVRPGDRIGMSLRNSELSTEPVYISLRRADQLEGYVILDQIKKIFDSNKEFFLNGFLSIQFDHIQMPHGSGGRVTRRLGETMTSFINRKATYFKYENPLLYNPGDEYCLPYALAISLEWHRRDAGEISRSEFNKILMYKHLRPAAEKLCLDAGVIMSNRRGGCSFDDVKQFQRYLQQYQIVIYGSESQKPMYTDEWYIGKRRLNIMFHNNHYTAMRSVAACYGARYFCEYCTVQTDTRAKHFCKYACTQCLVTPKCDTDAAKVECTECHRFFYGVKCHSNHLKKSGKRNAKTVCETRKNCPKCRSTFSKGHSCGRKFCFTCKKFVKKYNHMCYMPTYESKRQENEYLYVFYDIETQQSSRLNDFEPDKFKHVPNLCVTQTVCTECMKIEDRSFPCDHCGVPENVFDDTNCIKDLLDYVIEMSYKTKVEIRDGVAKTVRKFKEIVVIAHNNSGFDGQFVLKYIYDSQRFRAPKLIMNGTKITEISLANHIKFIDSLLYFQRGLADLPKLFGFKGSKGYYPYLMNEAKYDDYVGPLPKKQFYGYDEMMTDARKAFDEWYDSIDKSYVFDNRRELIEYCRMDVTILRKACVKFIIDFYDSNQIDPFVDGSTIASSCNKVFRSKYLKENTIGIVPAMGYRLSENQSLGALKWLTYLEFEHNIEIQHAGHGREYHIAGVGRVDGYHQNSNTVFEYDGCYWHSCIDCFPAYFPKKKSPCELSKRRDATVAKHNAIKKAGYNLVVKRECDFKRELEENPAVDELLNHHPMVVNGPLNPRDAFYGGRTNANTLYFKSDGVTKMHYFDICSLYPYINKTAPIPIGHPTVYVGDKCKTVSWENMNGLMKVTVSPPRGLAFPVLPTKMNNRLLFVLCRTCGINMMQCSCEHGEEERKLTGTWVMDEVKLAVKKGYKILEIHEIWSYETTQYDPVTRTGGLFTGFINHFLKIKTEASGWPNWCKTDKEKDNFIKKFFDKEGILLEKNKIEDNPALRAMAKLMLNSFWGRFGMRPNLPQNKVVQSSGELRKLILNPKIEMNSILPINQDKMIVTYNLKEEAVEPNNSTNVIIAAFTTSYARMELYKYLEMLGPDRVFYFDTDSVIFTSRPGDVMPELGDFLGQMTDELAKFEPGAYIIEFVSGGPKNYAIKVFLPSENKIKIIVKVKGVTLNYKNSKLLNFDQMKKMVVDNENNPVELFNTSIRRTNVAEVYTTRVKKTYRQNYNKRQKTGNNYSTIPYGY